MAVEWVIYEKIYLNWKKDLLQAFDNIFHVNLKREFQKYVGMRNLCTAFFGYFNSLESQSVFYQFCCQYPKIIYLASLAVSTRFSGVPDLELSFCWKGVSRSEFRLGLFDFFFLLFPNKRSILKLVLFSLISELNVLSKLCFDCS